MSILVQPPLEHFNKLIMADLCMLQTHLPCTSGTPTVDEQLQTFSPRVKAWRIEARVLASSSQV